MSLWEIWSYGEMPYGDLNGQQVLKMLEEGGRLSQPRKCPDVVYKVRPTRRYWAPLPASDSKAPPRLFCACFFPLYSDNACARCAKSLVRR